MDEAVVVVLVVPDPDRPTGATAFSTLLCDDHGAAPALVWDLAEVAAAAGPFEAGAVTRHIAVNGGVNEGVADLCGVGPRDFGWIFNAARLAVDLNRPREALEMIGDIKKLDWDYASTFFQNQVMITTAARAHHMLGEHEAELEVVEFGIELYPDLIGVRRNQLRARLSDS